MLVGLKKYDKVPEEKNRSCDGCDAKGDYNTCPNLNHEFCCKDFIYKLKAEGNMKKSDLKTGMRVEYRGNRTFCKTFAIVLLDTRDGDIILTLDGNSYMDLREYNKDLSWSATEGDFDIMAVYSAPTRSKDLFGHEKGKLLWERNQTHTISIDGEQRTVSHESFESLKDIFDTLE